MHHLFAHFVIFLSCFVRFNITCTTFLPFPCFIYFYPTVQCRLTHVDFALSVPLLSILALPYTFYCLSCFILSPIFSLSCLPFSSSSFLLLCFPCFLHLLVFLSTELPNENKNGQDSKRMFTWENSHRREFHTGMTFWFCIAFTWWMGHFISRYLKVHFMLIKYTCGSKWQTLRMRYPFQSTGRLISHRNGW